ncbi:hypothetical protein A2643_02580 [Candidatus Nomurabacteria bacterium RIFCSPHIGHO2_01_FULL_39_220]|uniref:LTD domain-containing protein n=1 Tax=Candidatus Nomurabacteria bacterium RIFCSPLOWO2_02_FULL_40_67 TaxID=1801787 RepID=A0A1F6Y306_9BACT|nr:MAG: S-layer-like protein array protein [Parcubacteria group bacterium GW2011_GWA2_40_37]OGI61723.1 MAG: hypothetical protein A2W12_02720 [Candidatus Nomurabacteria bacterium RBG_16_40_11]OGI70784.1 MAG: hypothetical protein A2643_02580 [Candidatus Nomurabacteria bacterium RIFCSPHIGHO2_01_FULL_39_220]OGI72201.1 MAG: hypothetical protein A2W56_04150 [Candidatus Nomurabacteria bacterium RIFCSPHIGHO2_02_41_18]OGI78178.1 MAG: hypothetical protein A3C65_00230 [Candidatus Nomurabacteria bacterium 
MLEINEIMYDLKTGSDEDREWVEIYNDSDVPMDLSSFRFFEADTSHKIKLVQGDANVPAKGYAIIAANSVKFKTDWPNFTGIVFDSSFSLSNDGEALMLKDKNLNIIDQYAYWSAFGGAGDGKSLQKITQTGNTVWVAARPTPGMENKIEKKTEIKPIAPVVKSRSIPEKVAVVQNEQKIPVENLAQNLPAQIVKTNNLPTFILILILLLGISVLVAHFIRKKRAVPAVGEDFKILDE